MSVTRKFPPLGGCLLGLALALYSAVGFGSSGKQLLSEDAVRAMGEEPGSGPFYQMPKQPHLDNADQNQAKGLAPSPAFYTSVAGSEFRPRRDHGNFFVPTDAALACRPAANNSLAEAQIQFPDGASLEFLRIYAGDSSPQDLNVALIERCQPNLGPSNVLTTILGSVETSGTPGRLTQAIGFPANTTVDNSACTYSLRLQLGDTANACADSNMFLDKARVQWTQ